MFGAQDSGSVLPDGFSRRAPFFTFEKVTYVEARTSAVFLEQPTEEENPETSASTPSSLTGSVKPKPNGIARMVITRHPRAKKTATTTRTIKGTKSFIRNFGWFSDIFIVPLTVAATIAPLNVCSLYSKKSQCIGTSEADNR